MKRDFLSVADLRAEELHGLLERAARLKALGRSARPEALLAGRAMALLFEKPSLRTRLSFELAMARLGGWSRFLGPGEVGLGQRESVADVGRTLGAYVDVVVVRLFDHAVAEALAAHCPAPVVNGLSDDEHPCQILADLLTLRERFGRLSGLTVAYVGDSNNVAHSLLLAAPLAGLNLCVASPAGYEPKPAPLAEADRAARERGCWVEVCRDPAVAVAGADAVYADAWYSMGQEHEAARRRSIFRDYQLNAALLARAQGHTAVMHCLPAHRGDEITDEVLDGPASLAFQQAANRLYAQQALLLWLLGE